MQQYWKGLGGPGTVGLELVLSVAVGLLGGAWLDKKLETGPWLTSIGLVYGLAAGGRAVYRAWRRADRELHRLEQEESKARKDFDDADGGRHRDG